MKIESAVYQFSCEMEKALEINKYKIPLNQRDLFYGLMRNVLDLNLAIGHKMSKKKIQKQAIDIANYALMISLDSEGDNLE